MIERKGISPLGLYVDGKRVRKFVYLGKPLAKDVLAWMEANGARLGFWLLVPVPAENPADAPMNMQRILDAARKAGADAVAHDTEEGSMPPEATPLMVEQQDGEG